MGCGNERSLSLRSSVVEVVSKKKGENMAKLPATKTHTVLTTIWMIFGLLCLAWLAGNITALVNPTSWVAQNNMPNAPEHGWPAEILAYFHISMIASIFFPILFCFITLYGLMKRHFYSLFTGYISLATGLFTNLIFNVVVIKCGSIDLYFIFKSILILAIELLALIFLMAYTVEIYKRISMAE